MLVAFAAGVRVPASIADPSLRYCCPDPHCGAPLILKRGTLRIAHFAHAAASACVLSRESFAHLQAKFDFAEEYRARGCVAEVEVPVPSPVEDRRADVLIASPRNGQLRYAIEFQDTHADERELWRRTRAYAAAGVRVVWIGLVRKEKWSPEREDDGLLHVRKYSPRQQERWIAAVAGEVWLYDPDGKLFWHAEFKEHRLPRGGVNFIDAGMGEHINVPPYDVASGRWVDACVTGPWALRNVLLSANAKRPIGTLTGKSGDDS